MGVRFFYIFNLVGFLLLWGLFGSDAAAPQNELNLHSTALPIENTQVAQQGSDTLGIPVNGEPNPVLMEVVAFYGLIGLAAFFLILALLNFVNKSETPHREAAQSDETHRN
jgi:hypothetical protein